ncbi:SpoIIE family protein phosphatase [Streptomyces sp. NPDC056190]|uniref:ATP-binding SpoIIE family protein phosphatase n=1 Tax=Streptomyces sp. NPDC056190 TaxID=3345741 RepID=UPI0035D91C37
MIRTARLRRRRPSLGRWRLAQLSPLILTVVIASLAFATPREIAFSRILPAAPALAASMWPVLPTVALGALCLVIMVGLSLVFQDLGTWYTAAAIVAVTAAAAYASCARLQREHTLVRTLQRSLLPRELPEQSAVEVATRYMPAQAGVGGDWFDVIPLPGARVALVVGDVVGHGLHAAATMGRLRTAVHNFSTLDLSPDELLGHLDELVARIDQELAAEGNGAAITGATCLYAIYDPISGQATIARAGHPGPALMHPDGTVTFPDVPVSPPLGLGSGMPIETAELHLPADSRLALYTDGLIENRDRDIDTSLELLRDVLAHPDRTPEQTCQAVIEALLPARPSDDIALLVARTQRLDPSQVANWDVQNEPTAVAPIRAACTRQLETWGLDHVAITTELIASELTTNAIRYGTAPIRLRLLHDRNNLICEVSDGSSTSPHVRRAATTDEGGRGLFLVTQFAQRWGTRYTARGKIIWTEQSLHDGAAEPGGNRVCTVNGGSSNRK